MSSSIPDDVATLVRSVGAAAPPYAGSLEQVQGRVTARRRRHVLAGSLASVLAVALAVGVPYALARPAAPAVLTPVPVASDPAPPPPAQRLFLQVGGFVAYPGSSSSEDAPPTLDPTKPNFGQPPGATGLVSLGGLKELLPDGSIVTHAAGGELVRPDGQFVTVYPRDLAPGVSRTDGPCVSDLAMVLEVRASDGAAVVSRDVREVCQVVSLAGSSDEEAYLVRAPADAQGFPLPGARLVAHRFADGVERDVLNLDALSGTVNDLNLNAGLAASVTGCRVVVVSLASGATVSDVSASPGGHCDRVRLSPDGRLAAVTVESSDGGGREGLIRVIDLATGSALVSSQVYASTADEEQRKFASKAFAGLAWVDDGHIRVAYLEPPVSSEDRIVTVDESARAVTLHVS